MNTFEIAREINNASDVELAEIFAYLNRFHNANGMVDDSSLKQEEMDFDIRSFMVGLEHSLNEIIYSEETDASAWWKDDKFFGRDTPKAKFLAQQEEFKQNRLMESAIVVNNIYRRMIEDDEIDVAFFNGDITQELTGLAREFEYEFFDTEDYNDDYVGVLEDWLPDKLKEMFPPKEPGKITLIVFLSDIISNYNGDDNLTEITLEEQDAIEWYYDTPKKDMHKSFWNWYMSDYTADDTVGLYSWLIENKKNFSVAGNLKR